MPPDLIYEKFISSQWRWQQAQSIATPILRHCMREDLHELIVHNEWNADLRNLSPDDIAVVLDVDNPRGTWIPGRIINVKRVRATVSLDQPSFELRSAIHGPGREK